MGGESVHSSQSAMWRVLLMALVLAYVLTDLLLGASVMDGASDDFWPQWTLAHLAAKGHGAGAYDFPTQAKLLRDLDVPGHRLEILKMPQIKNIGICPYPPTFVLLYAPFCGLGFNDAALVLYFISIGLALVAAWAIGQAAGDGLSGVPAAIALPFYSGIQSIILIGQESWWITILSCVTFAFGAAWVFGGVRGRWLGGMTAALAILCYPGADACLHLGQNSLFTLALLALGWQDLVRRRDLLAGLWWGVLVYKIHWLLAVGWVPVVIGRPRVLVGMAASAGVLALAATAFLGPAAWGKWAWQVVAVDHAFATDPFFREHLLIYACDVRNLVIRYTTPTAAGRIAGWLALAAVALVTAIWYRRRPAADPAGAEGPGLLFASGLTAAHLYYYDQTVFLLPLLVLWSRRPDLRRWQFVTLVLLTIAYYFAARCNLVWAGAFQGPPFWTFVILALWVLSLTVKSKEPTP